MEGPHYNDVDTLSNGFNFTPFSSELGYRVRMRADSLPVRRGRGLHGIVTDLDTGKRYKVYGRSCGLPNCMCDASIREVR